MNEQPEEQLIMREGYCCYCKNNPVESVVDASRIPGHPCNGCWFSDSKCNWEPAEATAGTKLQN